MINTETVHMKRRKTQETAGNCVPVNKVLRGRLQFEPTSTHSMPSTFVCGGRVQERSRPRIKLGLQ